MEALTHIFYSNHALLYVAYVIKFTYMSILCYPDYKHAGKLNSGVACGYSYLPIDNMVF